MRHRQSRLDEGKQRAKAPWNAELLSQELISVAICAGELLAIFIQCRFIYIVYKYIFIYKPKYIHYNV